MRAGGQVYAQKQDGMLPCTRADGQVEEAGWLVGNHMGRRVEKRKSELTGQSTSRHGHMDKLAGHPGGWPSKPVQVVERITTVDWITREGLCRLFRGSIRERFGPVIVPGNRSGEIRSGGGGRSEGRLSAVRNNKGISRDCIRGMS